MNMCVIVYVHSAELQALPTGVWGRVCVGGGVGASVRKHMLGCDVMCVCVCMCMCMCASISEELEPLPAGVRGCVCECDRVCTGVIMGHRRLPPIISHTPHTRLLTHTHTTHTHTHTHTQTNNAGR